MEENQVAVLGQEAEATAETSSPAVESETTVDESPSSEEQPTQTESEGTEEQASSEEPESLTDEEKSSLSSKTNSRMKYLAGEVKRLREQVGEGLYGVSTSQAPQPTSGLPWDNQELSEPREVTQDEYEQDLAKKADVIVKARMEQYERKQKLAADIRLLEDSYPELNQDSDRYDKELTDMIVDNYRKISKSDPSTTLASYASSIMSVRERSREDGKTEVTSKVVQQAAQQAVPSGGEPVTSEGSSEEELIKLRKEKKISFEEFERRVRELGK